MGFFATEATGDDFAAFALTSKFLVILVLNNGAKVAKRACYETLNRCLRLTQILPGDSDHLNCLVSFQFIPQILYLLVDKSGKLIRGKLSFTPRHVHALEDKPTATDCCFCILLCAFETEQVSIRAGSHEVYGTVRETAAAVN